MSRFIAAVHHLTLRLYPLRFRQLHAEELQAVFEQTLRDNGPRSAVRRTMWMMHLLWRSVLAGFGTRLDTHGQWAQPSLTGAAADIRYAFRALWRAPSYTISTVILLSSSLAFATVVHAISDGVLFKPLPYSNAHELYLIKAEVTTEPSTTLRSVSPSDVTAWRDALPGWPITVMSTQLTFGTRSVDEHFFNVTGLRPLIGGFQEEDFNWITRISNADQEFFTPVLLMHGRWRTEHGASPTIVNRQVTGSNRGGRRSGILVRGVLPPDFVFPLDLGEPPTSMIVPYQAPWFRPSDPSRTLQALIRIPDQVRIAEVEQRLLAATTRAAQLRPPRGPSAHAPTLEKPFDRVQLVPLTTHTGSSSRLALSLLAGAAALLLLLASVSITGLTAARAMADRQDLRIRRALGASAWRVIRLVLFQVVLIVLAAAGMAVVAAPALLDWTLSMLPPTLVLLKVPAIDLRVLGGVGLSSVACLCLVAVWPTVAALRIELSGRSASDTTPLNARRVSLGLIAAQACLGFVLLTAGLLTGASALATWTEDIGYDASRTVILDGFADNYASNEEGLNRLLAAEDRLRNVPGVSRLGYSNLQMFRGTEYLGGSSYGPGGAGPVEFTRDVIVDHDFFLVMGLRAIDGRLPTPAEWRGDQPLAVLSARAARLMFPGQSAVGQSLLLTRQPTAPALTVIGVVNDARYQALDREPVGEVYQFTARRPGVYGSFFVIRVNDNPEVVIPRLVDTAVAAGLNVERAQVIKDAVFSATVHRALPAWMFGSMSVIGLLIIVTGSIGLLTMAATQRKRELVVRTALGASPGDVMRLLVREQLLATLVGLLAGIAIAANTVHYLEAQLYRVTAFEPAVWTLTGGLLALVACAATVLPAMRFTRIDAAQALREG